MHPLKRGWRTGLSSMEQLQEHLGAWVDSPDPGSSDLSGANSATLQLEITRIQSVEPELCGTLDLLRLSTMQLFNAPSCRGGHLPVV